MFGETRARRALRGRTADRSRRSSQRLRASRSAATVDVRFGEAIYLAADIEWSRPASTTPSAGRLTLDGDLPLLHVHHEFAAPLAIVADGRAHGRESAAGRSQRSNGATFRFRALSDARSASGRLDARPGRSTLTRSTARDRSPPRQRRARSRCAAPAKPAARRRDPDARQPSRSADGRGLGRVRRAGARPRDRRRELRCRAGSRRSGPSRLTGNGQLTAELAPLYWSLESFDVSGDLRRPTARERPGRSTRRWTNVIASQPSSSLRERADCHRRRRVRPRADAAGCSSQSTARRRRAHVVLAPLVGVARREPRRFRRLLGGSHNASGSIEARDLALGVYSAASAQRRGRRRASEPTRRSTLRVEARRARARHGRRPTRLRADRSTAARARIESPSTHAGEPGSRRSPLPAVPRTRRTLARHDSRSSRSTRMRSAHGVLLDTARRRARAATASCSRRAASLHESGGRWCAELALEGKPEDRLVALRAELRAPNARSRCCRRRLSLEGVYQLSASFADLSGEPRGVACDQRRLDAGGGRVQREPGVHDGPRGLHRRRDLGETAQLDLSGGRHEPRTRAGVNLTTRIDDVRARRFHRSAGRLSFRGPTSLSCRC